MDQANRSESVFQHPLLRRITLIAIFLLALGVRLLNLTDLPVASTRELYSAKRARGMYFQVATDIPEWQRQIAIEQWRQTPVIEPAILEKLVSFTYRLTGPELWVARIYSILFWVVGGVALYLLASRLTTPDGGILALAFYLFFPFRIITSRNFQPDPLMVSLLIWFLWALERWSRFHVWKAAFLAGGWGGYLLHGLFYNYHNATHDYYQLPLVPVVALSLSPLIHPLTGKLLETWKNGILPRIVVILLLAFSLLMFGWDARRELRRVDYRPQAELWLGLVNN